MKYIASTLPMGEKCIFLAEVHKDEGRIEKDGKTVIESPPHMHVMFVPAVPDDKHDGFEFKLCADQLTKRSQLKTFHPKFQKWLDDAGIKATVHSGVTGGKNVSVSSMKKLTKDTGLTLSEIKGLQQKVKSLEEALKAKDAQLQRALNSNNDRTLGQASSWGERSSWESEGTKEVE
ncbi:MAG: plasmid recombination protein [Ruminococcus sp.]|nr:plasmid recombination protein [Ruminococcus sp.]